MLLLTVILTVSTAATVTDSPRRRPLLTETNLRAWCYVRTRSSPAAASFEAAPR
jgi:hypothetical protein